MHIVSTTGKESTSEVYKLTSIEDSAVRLKGKTISIKDSVNQYQEHRFDIEESVKQTGEQKAITLKDSDNQVQHKQAIGIEDSTSRLTKASTKEDGINSIVHIVSFSESVDGYPASTLTSEQEYIVCSNVEGSKAPKTLLGSKESSQDSEKQSNKG